MGTNLLTQEETALVNAQTGEIVEEKTSFQNTFDVSRMLTTAGKIELTEEQEEILYAPVDEDDIEIRPDGLVYAPWMEYALRLRKTFGLQWALIPQGMPTFKDNFIYWGFWLVIKGHLCSYAIGEQKYFTQSKAGKDFMTYGDACEGAKSNALMRLCKGVGISLELWKPSFIRKWKGTYAETYKKEGKTYWKKKGEPNGGLAEPGPEEPSGVDKPITEPQRKKLWAMMKEKGLDNKKAKAFYDSVTPKISREASDFIEHFDARLKAFLKKPTPKEEKKEEKGVPDPATFRGKGEVVEDESISTPPWEENGQPEPGLEAGEGETVAFGFISCPKKGGVLEKTTVCKVCGEKCQPYDEWLHG